MAGIEPASEKFHHQMSTSVDDHLFLYKHDGSTYHACTSCLDPKALFCASNSVETQHSDFIFALSATGQRAELEDVAYEETIALCPSPRRLRALRRMKCGWHLIVCTDFTRSVPLGSQSRAILSRRNLSSPSYLFIIP